MEDAWFGEPFVGELGDLAPPGSIFLAAPPQVALANKMARIAWAMMVSGEVYRAR